MSYGCFNKEPWLVKFLLQDDEAHCPGQTLQVIKYLQGPLEDGGVVKLVSDGVNSIAAVFTGEAVDKWKKTAEENDEDTEDFQGTIIVKKYSRVHVSHQQANGCMFVLQVNEFQPWANLAGFMFKAVMLQPCMQVASVKCRSLDLWKQWSHASEGSCNESSSVGSLSQLLALMATDHQQTEAALPPMSVTRLLVPETDEKQLENLKEWQAGYIPPSSSSLQSSTSYPMESSAKSSDANNQEGQHVSESQSQPKVQSVENSENPKTTSESELIVISDSGNTNQSENVNVNKVAMNKDRDREIAGEDEMIPRVIKHAERDKVLREDDRKEEERLLQLSATKSRPQRTCTGEDLVDVVQRIVLGGIANKDNPDANPKPISTAPPKDSTKSTQGMVELVSPSQHLTEDVGSEVTFVHSTQQTGEEKGQKPDFMFSPVLASQGSALRRQDKLRKPIIEFGIDSPSMISESRVMARKSDDCKGKRSPRSSVESLKSNEEGASLTDSVKKIKKLLEENPIVVQKFMLEQMEDEGGGEDRGQDSGDREGEDIEEGIQGVRREKEEGFNRAGQDKNQEETESLQKETRKTSEKESESEPEIDLMMSVHSIQQTPPIDVISVSQVMSPEQQRLSKLAQPQSLTIKATGKVSPEGQRLEILAKSPIVSVDAAAKEFRVVVDGEDVSEPYETALSNLGQKLSGESSEGRMLNLSDIGQSGDCVLQDVETDKTEERDTKNQPEQHPSTSKDKESTRKKKNDSKETPKKLASRKAVRNNEDTPSKSLRKVRDMSDKDDDFLCSPRVQKLSKKGKEMSDKEDFVESPRKQLPSRRAKKGKCYLEKTVDSLGSSINNTPQTEDPDFEVSSNTDDYTDSKVDSPIVNICGKPPRGKAVISSSSVSSAEGSTTSQSEQEEVKKPVKRRTRLGGRNTRQSTMAQLDISRNVVVAVTPKKAKYSADVMFSSPATRRQTRFAKKSQLYSDGPSLLEPIPTDNMRKKKAFKGIAAGKATSRKAETKTDDKSEVEEQENNVKSEEEKTEAVPEIVIDRVMSPELISKMQTQKESGLEIIEETNDSIVMVIKCKNSDQEDLDKSGTDESQSPKGAVQMDQMLQVSIPESQGDQSGVRQEIVNQSEAEFIDQSVARLVDQSLQVSLPESQAGISRINQSEPGVHVNQSDPVWDSVNQVDLSLQVSLPGNHNEMVSITSVQNSGTEKSPACETSGISRKVRTNSKPFKIVTPTKHVVQTHVTAANGTEEQVCSGENRELQTSRDVHNESRERDASNEKLSLPTPQCSFPCYQIPKQGNTDASQSDISSVVVVQSASWNHGSQQMVTPEHPREYYGQAGSEVSTDEQDSFVDSAQKKSKVDAVSKNKNEGIKEKRRDSVPKSKDLIITDANVQDSGKKSDAGKVKQLVKKHVLKEIDVLNTSGSSQDSEDDLRRRKLRLNYQQQQEAAASEVSTIENESQEEISDGQRRGSTREKKDTVNGMQGDNGYEKAVVNVDSSGVTSEEEEVDEETVVKNMQELFAPYTVPDVTFSNRSTTAMFACFSR